MSRAVIVAGTQSFNDYEMVEKTLLQYFKEHYLDLFDIEILSGDMPGANKLGEIFAEKHGLALSKFSKEEYAPSENADWLRNEKMAEYAASRQGVVFAFWDGHSEGTKSMLTLAKKHNLEVHTLFFEGKAVSSKLALDVNGVFGLSAKQGSGVVDTLDDLYDLDPSIRSF